MSADCGLSQSVDIPTRKGNILDLIFTNRPLLVDQCCEAVGLSDHDMVLFSLQCYIPKNPCSYKCFLWHKADFESMKRELCDFANNLMTDYSIETLIEQLWCVFPDKLLLALDSCVPSKTSTNNTKHPWINRKIIWLSRRKQRKYNFARKTQSPSAW